ncbi:MAG: hypothetical protein FJY67_11390 [Calditrichaeota bacterium]|nr:hypothetical protein [Calditrichota bacterium]
MQSSIPKIPYALLNDEVVDISRALNERAKNYHCPMCNEVLILRKEHLRSRTIKVKAHFAHRSEPQCSSESQLHYWAKRFFKERFEVSISNAVKFYFKWECEQCFDEHNGNFCKEATETVLEKDFGECRPDICLIDKEGKPRIFVEIVVSHAPEDNVIEYVQANDIALVEMIIENEDDLEEIRHSNVLMVAKVNKCKNPPCRICDKPMKQEILYIFDTECWRCRMPITIAQLKVSGYSESVENGSILICYSHF